LAGIATPAVQLAITPGRNSWSNYPPGSKNNSRQVPQKRARGPNPERRTQTARRAMWFWASRSHLLSL